MVGPFKKGPLDTFKNFPCLKTFDFKCVTGMPEDIVVIQNTCPKC